MAVAKGFARKQRTPKIEVRRAEHGLGVFAAEDIPWGWPIIEYVGKRISKEESDSRCRFYNRVGYNCVFELDEKHDIDGIANGNESRFINHSMKPNCVPIRFNGSIYICSIDKIKAGMELLFDYGFKP